MAEGLHATLDAWYIHPTGCAKPNLQCSNSAHEPQKVVVDYQALTHFEVHGRNARNKVPGKSHYGQSPRKTGGFRAQALG
jgi:hypothetical protein